MGARWLYRLRTRLRARIFRFRERHQNRVIARQQKEISELSTQLSRIGSDFEKKLSDERQQWESERGNLSSQLALCQLERTTLEEMNAAFRARVEELLSISIRNSENARHGLDKLK